MKIALVYALPFHEWILRDLKLNLIAMGESVQEFTHHPKHDRDWLQSNPKGLVFRQLEAYDPDVIIAADYPFDIYKRFAGAMTVATRHSIASRGNTWEKEHLLADVVLAWSAWDVAHWARPDAFFIYRDCLLTGCIWTSALLRADADPEQATKPIVLWMPSHNKDFSCRDQVVKELWKLRRDFEVVVRPHAATAWREPTWLANLNHAGLTVVDPNQSPDPWLLGAACLITDVSGSAFLGLSVPDSRLPIIQVDPPRELLKGPQYNPDGPEWIFRDQIGSRAGEGFGVADMVQKAVERDENQEARLEVRRVLLGDDEWAMEASKRAARMIVEKATGKQEQSHMTR